MLGEVDWIRRVAVDLSWHELAEGSGGGHVVMPQVLGQDLAQVVLIDDQQPCTSRELGY
jgi:hypothetical protein